MPKDCSTYLDLEIDAFVRQSADEKRTQLQKGVNVFVDAVAKASNKEVDMQNFETTAEANAYRQELEDKGGTVYQSENYGDFVLDDKTGDITVIIDDQVNTEDNVVTTEVHEGGHILVSATVKKDPKAAAKLGNSLLEELASNSNIEIKNDRVAQKIAQYVADGVSTADVMEEVLMFTSQALIDGEIHLQLLKVEAKPRVFKFLLEGYPGKEYMASVAAADMSIEPHAPFMKEAAGPLFESEAQLPSRMLGLGIDTATHGVGSCIDATPPRTSTIGHTNETFGWEAASASQ